MKEKGLVKTIFLVWTCLRESVPLNLRSTKTDVEVVIGLENLKCHDYYCHLIKNKYERPKKWAKLADEFDLRVRSEMLLLEF